MYAIYPFQKYKFTHYCMWDIDWKKLDRIYSYTFSGLEKTQKKHTLQRHCDIENKNKYGHKGKKTKLEKQTQETALRQNFAFACSTVWGISENWFINGWSTFSSLVKVKIHLHNSWQIYKKTNRNV